MFGSNNMIVMEKLVAQKQAEIAESAQRYRFINEAAEQSPSWWKNVAWQLGRVSIRLGRWLQLRANIPYEAVNQPECA
ncbi:MAG TPA: hypothetical protein VHO48_14270 [Anaerolineaceae bacterium]|nr:hypothetical protein [Anaerolineaceae bacterium]